MSGVRHQDAPVMPLGPSVLAPHLRHLVGDLDLWLHSDQFLMALTHTYTHVVIFLAAMLILVDVYINFKSLQWKKILAFNKITTLLQKHTYI